VYVVWDNRYTDVNLNEVKADEMVMLCMFVMMDGLKERGCNLIRMSQDRDQRRTFVDTIISLKVS
jgi:hypothetical protein